MENLTAEDLKSNEGLKKFDSVDALAKSYVNLEALKGNSIRINGPDASTEARAETMNKIMQHMPELMLKPNPDNAEQMKEYYAMTGVPESVDGYAWDGEGLSDEILGELKGLAAETKMSKQQFKQYVTKMAEMQGFTQQQHEDSRIRQGAELKTDWGMAFEDRYAVVEGFVNDHPGLGSVESLSPAQMKELYDISRSTLGVKQAGAQPVVSKTLMAPDELNNRINEIHNNPVYYSDSPADRIAREALKASMNKLILLRAGS